jgi:hypothetical protein
LLEKQNQLILQQRDDLQAIVDKTPVRKWMSIVSWIKGEKKVDPLFQQMMDAKNI